MKSDIRRCDRKELQAYAFHPDPISSNFSNLAQYSAKENPDVEAKIDQTIGTLIDLIERKYLSDDSNTRPMDFAQIAQYFTLDVITELSLGQSFGYLENDEDVYAYVKTMEDNFPAMNFMSAVPALARMMRMQWFQKLALPTIKDKVGMGKVKGYVRMHSNLQIGISTRKILCQNESEYMLSMLISCHRVAREIIAYRFKIERQPHSDMLASFIKHGLSLQEAADESLLQILAGSDTSATVIRMALLHIITCPRIYSRLVNEIISTYPLPSETEANISSESRTAQILTYAQTVQLPYLTACLKETIRIWPVATGVMPKIVPSTGDHLSSGIYLPPGTEIGHCAIGIHHNPSVYGSDAHIFRPERWFPLPSEITTTTTTPTAEFSNGSSNPHLAQMEKTHELAFGYGRFKCLGERIARIEIWKAMAELIRRYEWQVVDPMKPFEKSVNMGLFIQKGMGVVVTRRKG